MFSVVSYKSSAWICDIAGLARRFNVIEQASILVFLCDHTHMACVPLGAVVEGCVSFMSEVQTLPQGFAAFFEPGRRRVGLRRPSEKCSSRSSDRVKNSAQNNSFTMFHLALPAKSQVYDTF